MAVVDVLRRLHAYLVLCDELMSKSYVVLFVAQFRVPLVNRIFICRGAETS